MRQRRLSILMSFYVQRQFHRQLSFGNGHHTAMLAIHDRNGSAPVPLTGNIPVTQTPIGRAPPLSRGFKCIGDTLLGLFIRQSSKFAGIDQSARSSPRFSHGRGIKSGLVVGLNDHQTRDTVLAGKFEIALVVRRDSHDRTGTVFGKHKVAEPDGYPGASERIDAIGAGEYALFFEGVGLPVDTIHVSDAFDERSGLGFNGFARNEGFY